MQQFWFRYLTFEGFFADLSTASMTPLASEGRIETLRPRPLNSPPAPRDLSPLLGSARIELVVCRPETPEMPAAIDWEI